MNNDKVELTIEETNKLIYKYKMWCFFKKYKEKNVYNFIVFCNIYGLLNSNVYNIINMSEQDFKKTIF